MRRVRRLGVVAILLGIAAIAALSPPAAANGPMMGGGGGGSRGGGGGGLSPGAAGAIGGLLGGFLGGMASQPAPQYAPQPYYPAPLPPPPPPQYSDPGPQSAPAPYTTPPVAANPIPDTPAPPPPPPAVQGVATIDTVSDGGYGVTVSAQGGPEQPIGPGQTLRKGQIISTGVGTEVDLSFPDGSKMHINEMTQIVVDDIATRGSRQTVNVQLKLGDVSAQVNPKHDFQSDFKLTTPSGNAGVRGTKFKVAYNPQSRVMTVAVTEGVVAVAPAKKPSQRANLLAGQQVEITPDGLGQVTLLAPPAATAAKTPAPLPTAANFDGTWSVIQLCPSIGNTFGYTSAYVIQIKDGKFHDESGSRDQPGWGALDGTVAPDGAVKVRFDGLIGTDKAHTAGNAQPGSHYGYDVEGRITGDSGTGLRKSARHCDWTFTKLQPLTGAVADISGNWTTQDGRIIDVKQNGNQVSWTSCCQPGHENLVVNVAGTFDGKTLAATYHFRENDSEGDGVLLYAFAGDRLDGTLRTPDGNRMNASLSRSKTAALANLTGKWTTVSGHTLDLVQTGNEVKWTTCCRSQHPGWTADIAATFDGKNLTGMFRWKEGDRQGNGTVSYTLAGYQLEGQLEVPGKEPMRSVLTNQAVGGTQATPPPSASPNPANAPSEPATQVAAAPPAAQTPTAPAAQCQTEPLDFRFSDNPSLSSKQTSIGGGVCGLNYKTGSPGAATIVSAPSHGTLAQLEPLKLRYQPAEGFKGADRYVVKLCDQAGCATITYRVTVE